MIADASADPETVARELVAQAEHDPDAAVGAIVIGDTIADAIATAVMARIAVAPRRREIIEGSLSARGALLTAPSLAAAIDLANAWAPEHLLLAVTDPAAAFAQVRDAGTVFLGESSSVAFGDYMTGANHVLPTGDSHRCTPTGLSTLDFVRWTTYQRVDRAAARRLAAPVATFAHRPRDSPGRTLPPRPRGSMGTHGRSSMTTTLARAAYRDIPLYTPDKTPVAIDLSDNTNLWGVPPGAAGVIGEASARRRALPDVVFGGSQGPTRGLSWPRRLTRLDRRRLWIR